MISTTFNGQAVLLVTAAPNWENPVTTTHELVGASTVSLSNRESRRPHSAAMRAGLAFVALLSDLELRAAVGSLKAWAGEPVLCPFWPGVTTWANRATAPIGGGLKIVWKADWSQWELYTTTAPIWPDAADLWAPVLWGVFSGRDGLPGGKWYNAALEDLEIEVEESGPADYALAPVAGTVTAGPLPPSGYGAAPKLFPFFPNFTGLQDAFTVRVRRETTGFRRQQSLELYPQAVARVQSLDYQLGSASEIAAFLSFFASYSGRGAAFWIPSWTAAAVLTAAVASGDSVLAVEDSVAVAAGDFLALISGGVRICRRVLSVTGTTVTLDAAVGADLPASTLVSPLLLARQDRATLRLEWTHGDLADATISVRELPTEYAPGADETVGTTLGQLPERCLLYDFTRDHGGTLLHDRFTSYERDVTYGGFTWTSADVSHGAIKAGLALDADRVELTSQVFTGNPLVALGALKSEAPVRCTIMSGDVSTSAVVSGVVILAVGEVDKARIRGTAISAGLSPGGWLLDQQAPRFDVGPLCNHGLFSSGCGLSRSAWVHTGLVNGAPTAAFPFAVSIDNLARTTGPTPTWFVDWFAGGWIEIGTPGTSTWQRRAILTSTAPVSGAFSVTLHRAFDPLPADNAAVILFPGCDLTRETCRAYNAGTNPRGKFDNYPAFGGHPEVPASNPSMVKISANMGGGKK